MEDSSTYLTEDYEYIGQIGAGSYGIVFVYKDRRTGLQVACKKLRNFSSQLELKATLRELKVLRIADHPNVIQILRAITKNENTVDPKIFLIMTYFPFDLRKILILRNQNSINLEPVIKIIIYQILMGVQYLHSGNILHRDLKPENILINHENSKVAICDFGFARFRDDEKFEMTNYVTTRPYRAPEIIFGQASYSKEVDIWSIGCIFFELLTKKHAFMPNNHSEHIKSLVEIFGSPSIDYWSYIQTDKFKKFTYNFGVYPNRNISKTISEKIDPEALQLLDSLLEFHPAKRISAIDAMKHPYFSDIYSESHLQNFYASHDEFKFETDPDLSEDYLKLEIMNEIAILEKRQPVKPE
jgi:serine/threonine protein kinase